MNLTNFFLELDQEIHDCNIYLSQIPPLEYYKLQNWLSIYFLIRITGKYETTVGIIIEERIKKCNDLEVINYIKKTLKHSKLLKLENIKEILNKFDESKNSQFKDKLNENLQSKVDYNSIANNRDNFTHGMRINLSWLDLQSMYYSSKKILFFVNDILLK